MSNQSTTETTDAKRYVIRANGAADYIYWSDDEPYVEHGIKYEWYLKTRLWQASLRHSSPSMSAHMWSTTKWLWKITRRP